MENEVSKKVNLIIRIKDTYNKKKKFFIVFFSFIILIIISLTYFNYYKNNLVIKISEKYIQAGLHLASNNLEQSKNTYKEIIKSKNKFYSLLSLNTIIDNDLIKNNDEIIKLFEIVEDIKMNKEEKNLIKLKKILYLIKSSKIEDANKILEEMKSSKSIWYEAALEIANN